MDAIASFADHVVRTRFQDLPSDAIKAAKIFILDTFGVGTAGSSGPMACDLVDMQETWGHRGEARVWGNGKRLPAPAAAMCNAYQVHNAEFDCVHEEAVVHAMTVVLPVAIASAERRKGVSGADLIAAVTLGVDVAAGLGVAATTGLRFFRPATAGAFGGTAALGKLMGLDHYAMINAFSIAYGQSLRHHAGAHRGILPARHADGLQCAQCRRRLRSCREGIRWAEECARRPVRLFQADRDKRRAGARRPGSWPAPVHNGARA